MNRRACWEEEQGLQRVINGNSLEYISDVRLVDPEEVGPIEEFDAITRAWRE